MSDGNGDGAPEGLPPMDYELTLKAKAFAYAVSVGKTTRRGLKAFGEGWDAALEFVAKGMIEVVENEDKTGFSWVEVPQLNEEVKKEEAE